MGTIDWGRMLSRWFSVGTLFALSAAGCRPTLESNFDVARWQGKRLDSGATVRLADLRNRRVVINVYSPTCAPCVQELPAINLLYRRLNKLGIPVFLVVDSRPPAHFPEDGTAARLVERLRQDVARFRIEAPVLMMGPEFRVAPRDGLISGNPETLIFDTGPLRLRYNFIGPISRAQTEAELQADPRFQFVLKQI